MNIIVKIEDREAIPVRAIPLLTDWQGMTPDELARALAWDEETPRSHRLSAFYVDADGKVQAFSARWWETWVCRPLKALSDRIKREEVSHEDGHEKWRRESLTLFPAGSFVWKDEFEKFYARRIGQFGSMFISPTQNGEMSPSEKERWLGLELTPNITDPTTWRVVMEGFSSKIPSSLSATSPVDASVLSEPETPKQSGAPALAGSASNKQPGKVWSDERKAEARAYREKHGLTKTAEYYGVTRTTISKHIPIEKEKEKEKSLGPWSGL